MASLFDYKNKNAISMAYSTQNCESLTANDLTKKEHHQSFVPVENEIQFICSKT